MKTPILSHVLIAVASVLTLIVLTAAITTLYVRRTMKPIADPPAPSTGPAPAMRNIRTVGVGEATYTGVGSVRTVTAATEGADGAEDGVPVAVTAWFSYPKDDSVFFEELSSKSTLIRKTIKAYFAAYTKDELMQKGEEAVKQELRGQINELLTLGEVGELYFSEYIFLD